MTQQPSQSPLSATNVAAIADALQIIENLLGIVGEEGAYGSRLATARDDLRKTYEAISNGAPAPLPGGWGEVRGAVEAWRLRS
jgi:hypothetical protein